MDKTDKRLDKFVVLFNSMTSPFVITDGFPETFLANKSLFPSRLSCENNYGQLSAPKGLFPNFSSFLRLIFTLAFLVLGSVVRSGHRTRSNAEDQKSAFLILTHYLGSHKSYQDDSFWGSIAKVIRDNFSTQTFFLNSSNERASKVVAEVNKGSNYQFSVNELSFRLRELLTNFKNLVGDLSRSKAVFEAPDTPMGSATRRIIINQQMTRSTLSILLAWDNFAKLISQTKPRFVLMTCEGNSHELLFVHRIKKYFPSVHIVLYQHAPLVKDQPGFFNVITNLRDSDFLLLSSTYSVKLMKETLSEDFPVCKILKVGSDRASKHPDLKGTTPSVKLDNNSARNILIAPEGTDCALEEMLHVLRHYQLNYNSHNIKLRLHPDYVPSNKFKKILASFPVDCFSSKSKLADDLKWADEVWFRCSSIVDAALRNGVLPVHINLNPRVDLNPIKGLDQPQLEIRTIEDVRHLDKMRKEMEGTIFKTDDANYLFEEIDESALEKFVELCFDSDGRF